MNGYLVAIRWCRPHSGQNQGDLASSIRSSDENIIYILRTRPRPSISLNPVLVLLQRQWISFNLVFRLQLMCCDDKNSAPPPKKVAFHSANFDNQLFGSFINNKFVFLKSRKKHNNSIFSPPTHFVEKILLTTRSNHISASVTLHGCTAKIRKQSVIL